MAYLCGACNQISDFLEGRTDRGKTVYPPPPSGSGGIIRSKIGSKCVDLLLIGLAKCWNNFFFLQNFVYDYTVKKASIWLYCENVKSEYFFFSPVQPNFFLQDSESKYFFRKKPCKINIEWLEGRLINKFARPKWFSHKATKKWNKAVVIRKSHEKIFPSKIRLFFISPNWICANYFTYNELYIFF